jgi:hypothetical protein
MNLVFLGVFSAKIATVAAVAWTLAAMLGVLMLVLAAVGRLGRGSSRAKPLVLRQIATPRRAMVPGRGSRRRMIRSYRAPPGMTLNQQYWNPDPDRRE